LYLWGASYHLKIPGYRQFLMGALDAGGVYYIWNPTGRKWERATADAPAFLAGLKNAALPGGAHARRTSSRTGAASIGYEGELTFSAFKTSGAAALQGFTARFEGQMIGAPLPGGTSGVPAEREYHLILALYRDEQTPGDILLFDRPASWFAGEAELFNSTEILCGASYEAKALSLLFELYQKDGLGSVFKERMRQYYPGVTFDLFEGASRGKTDALKKLPNALNTALSNQLSHQIQNRSVFDVSRTPQKQMVLYGNNRNIYIDAYLLFHYAQNKPVFADAAPGQAASRQTALRQISAAEGQDMARFAMRYFTWGVEYSKPQSSEYYYQSRNFLYAVMDDNRFWETPPERLVELPVKRSDTVSTDSGSEMTQITLEDFQDIPSFRFDSPFEMGRAGYPLPYFAGGSDSPASFARKMMEAYKSAIFSNMVGPRRISAEGKTTIGYWPSTAHIPHIGAGVDGAGFLAGCLAMNAELDQAVPGGARTGSARRFSAGDLDGISVIVPDLSLIRPGDLVLRFRSPQPGEWVTDIAIVAGFRKDKPLPAYGIDQQRFMEDILLISPSEDIGQVTLAAWRGNSNFSSRSEGFHVRRLLREGAEEGSPLEQPGSVTDFQPVLLEAMIHTMEEQDRRVAKVSVKERWIPNTGEFLLLTEVEIHLENSSGADLLRENIIDMELVISGAIDRNYDAARTAPGNVYNNSAGGTFEIALVSESKAASCRLGILEYNGSGRYDMNYADSVLYTAQGNRFSGTAGFAQNRLWVNGENRLSMLYNGQTWQLGIRPLNPFSLLNPTGAKPGDDLLLEFALRRESSAAPLTFILNNETREIRFPVIPADYIALYDKRVLWRANLYIDEGESDWNDDHPWNAPGEGVAAPGHPWWKEDWGCNDWNTGNSRAIAGGQIMEILPWTHWDEGAAEMVYRGSVAYSWSGEDPVSKFNDKLRDQMARIAGYWSDTQNTANLLAHGSPQTSSTSTAPGGKWENYVFPARSMVNGKWDYDRPKTEQELDNNAQHFFYINNSDVSTSVFVPGLSSYWDEKKPSLFADNQKKYSSGIDCSGFVYQAANYSGNPYYLGAHRYATGTIATEESARYIIRGGWNSLSAEEGRENDVAETDRQYISLAVPGDIFVKAGIHTALVQDIRADSEGKITTFDQVSIIHSVGGNAKGWPWSVRIDPWQEMVSTFREFSLVRFK
jgi:hypothetical protein